MRIAISQREIILENSVGESLMFDGLERAWHSFLRGHNVIPVPNTVKFNPDHLDFDCLIISGGPDSVARHYSENALYALARERGIPVIGVCHGAFVINDIEGGENGNTVGHIGTNHFVNIGGVSHMVNSYHSQCILALPVGFHETARDHNGGIEAFEHDTLPIYGIVWHPERMAVPVLTPVVENLLFKS